MYQPPQPKKISIIIPNWFAQGQNGKYGENETLWFAIECLNRLLNVTPKNLYELILIDNGSTIGQEIFDLADVLIRNKYNLGFGPACNQGFAVARGEYIICMNNDILVWADWIDALLEPFEKLKLEPPVGVVMPALMKETRDAREALKIETINLTQNHNIFSPQAEFGSCWIIKKIFLEELKKRTQTLTNPLGHYFNENFKIGFGEDRDLWDRVREAGFETYRTHNTRVFHQGNMSIGKIKNRQKYTFANRKYLAELRANRKNKITIQ